LISLIERYDLQQYDALVLGDKTTIIDTPVTKTDQHLVRSGDTLYSISRAYNLTVDQLKSYNNLKTDVLSVGQVLTLRPQAKK